MSYQLGSSAASKKTRIVYLVIVASVAAVVGLIWYQGIREKKEFQAKVDAGDRWAGMEKKKAGAFWECVLGPNVDVGLITSGAQFQMRVESAYATQPKTYSEYLSSSCLPQLEGVTQAFTTLTGMPAEFKTQFEAYKKALPKLQDGLEEYAKNIKSRASIREIDKRIQEYGVSWHNGEAGPKGYGYERFLRCAIPEISKKKDAQAILEFLADACYKKDAGRYMTDVRKRCAPHLQKPATKGASKPKTWRASQKKFVEGEARQLRAWSSCAQRSRKTSRDVELEPFMKAFGEYMKARAEMVKAVRDLMASAKK